VAEQQDEIREVPFRTKLKNFHSLLIS